MNGPNYLDKLLPPNRPSRVLLRADGTAQVLDDPLSMRELAELIDAQTVDSVLLRHLGHPLHVMIVDDHGWEFETVEVKPAHYENRPTRALKPINAAATVLYHRNCQPGTTHEIAGDVVVVPDSDFGGVGE